VFLVERHGAEHRLAGRATLSILTVSIDSLSNGANSGKRHSVARWHQSLFALDKTAHYYVVAYTKIRPTCSIACNF
jgi:hypothetical protein